MKRFNVSLPAVMLLVSIAIPAFATVDAPSGPTQAAATLQTPTTTEASLLQESFKIIKPKQFKGIVREMDTQKNVLFLKKRGKKERILITPKTVVLDFSKDEAGVISAEDLVAGDMVYGFVRRVPKIEVEENEIFFAGLVVIRINLDAEELEELQGNEASLVVPEEMIQTQPTPTTGPTPPAGTGGVTQ